MTSPSGKISIGLSIDATNLAGELVAQIRSGLNPALADVETQVGGLATTFDGLGSGAFDAVIDGAKQAGDAITEVTNQATQAQQDAATVASAAAAAAEAAANVGNKVSSGLDKAIAKGRDFSQQMTEIRDSVSNVSQGLDKYGPAGSFAGGVIDEMLKPATAAIDGINSALTAADKINNIIGGASDLVRGVSEGIREAMAEDVSAIKDQLLDLPKSLSKLREQSWDENVTMITDGVGKVGDAVAGLGDKAARGLSLVSQVGRSIETDLRGVTSAAGKVADAFGVDISGAISFVDKGLDGFSKGFNAVDTVATQIQTVTGAFKGVSDSVREIGDLLQGLPGKAQGLGKMFAGNRGMFGTALLAGGSAAAGSESGLAQGIGALSSIAGGALMGSAFGPLGATAGALAGGGLALTNYLLAENARAAQAAADAQAQFQAQLDRTNAATLIAKDATKTLNDALISSSGKIDGTALGAVQQQITNLPELLSSQINPESLERVNSLIQSLGMTMPQLASQVAGSQPMFDALVSRLHLEGDNAGYTLANALTDIRTQLLEIQDRGAGAASVLQQVAESTNGDLAQAQANIETAFAAIPENIPINIDAKGGQAVLDILHQLNIETAVDAEKNITIPYPAQLAAVEDGLRRLNILVTTNNDKQILVRYPQGLAEAMGALDGFIAKYANIIVTPIVKPTYVPGNAGSIILPGYGTGGAKGWFGGNADGGVLPGFSPGVDDMLWPMSGGEGVLIPEVVRALGASFVYSLNAMYRPGLRKGFADGGVNTPTIPSGMSPLASEIASGLAGAIAPVIGLLTQIRDNQTSIGTTTGIGQSGDKTTDQLKTGAGQLVGDAINAAGPTAGAVGADVIKAGLGTGNRIVDIPADTLKLMAEQNPAALFSALGYKVGDYSRTGGNGDDILANTNKISANGALYSDTAALVDRTLTSMEATADARQQQLLDVLGQIRDQLAELIGQVVTAVAKTASSSAGQAASQAIGGITGMASGGVLPGYSPGVDNLLVPMSGGEGVLIPEAVRGLGPGFVHGINAMFRGGRAGRGGVGYSSGGVVDVTQSVGADFFGLSQIPIIGTIVNALVGILLKIVGVEIESRNTLQEMGKDFRAFRGDFMAFDASGRIASDTSGLVDRDLSSKDVVNNERVRILTQVIVGVIKYVIEKVIKPIVDSVIQSAIQFGQQALNMGVSAGLNAMAPGAGAAGSMVSNFLSSMVGSAANAASQVGSEIVSQFASEGLSAIVSVIGQALPNGLFSLFDIGGLLTALFGGVAAGAAGGLGMLGGKIGTFDEGGLAKGVGYMAKNTIEPELVLGPGMTRSFARFIAMLESGALNGSGSNTTTVHAPIHVQGQNAPTQIRSQLLELISV